MYIMLRRDLIVVDHPIISMLFFFFEALRPDGPKVDPLRLTLTLTLTPTRVIAAREEEEEVRCCQGGGGGAVAVREE